MPDITFVIWSQFDKESSHIAMHGYARKIQREVLNSSSVSAHFKYLEAYFGVKAKSSFKVYDVI